VRQVVILNPAASVRAERYAVVEGKTPEISAKQARNLLKSVDPSTLVCLLDRAIIAVLRNPAARVGALANLTLESLKHDGRQYALRFSERRTSSGAPASKCCRGSASTRAVTFVKGVEEQEPAGVADDDGATVE
jgi:hypothetical protein